MYKLDEKRIKKEESFQKIKIRERETNSTLPQKKRNHWSLFALEP
jgi:hypothetical protein